MVLRRQERSDVARKTKYGRSVRLMVSVTSGSAAVHELAQPASYTLLPVGERPDVSVDAGIWVVFAWSIRIPSS